MVLGLVVKLPEGGMLGLCCCLPAHYSVCPLLAYWNATRAFMILSGMSCFAGIIAGILSFAHFSAFERFNRSFAAGIMFFVSSESHTCTPAHIRAHTCTHAHTHMHTHSDTHNLVWAVFLMLFNLLEFSRTRPTHYSVVVKHLELLPTNPFKLCLDRSGPAWPSNANQTAHIVIPIQLLINSNSYSNTELDMISLMRLVYT